jgi:hypothetical protein
MLIGDVLMTVPICADMLLKVDFYEEIKKISIKISWILLST